MCVFKYHAFIYFLRPPPWYGTCTVVIASHPLLTTVVQIQCCNGILSDNVQKIVNIYLACPGHFKTLLFSISFLYDTLTVSAIFLSFTFSLSPPPILAVNDLQYDSFAQHSPWLQAGGGGAEARPSQVQVSVQYHWHIYTYSKLGARSVKHLIASICLPALRWEKKVFLCINFKPTPFIAPQLNPPRCPPLCLSPPPFFHDHNQTKKLKKLTRLFLLLVMHGFPSVRRLTPSRCCCRDA